MLHMENTEQRVNGPKWSNRTAHFVWTGPTKKRGPARDPWGRGCSKLFRFDRTDPFSFKPKFQEILVEWTPPTVSFFQAAKFVSATYYVARAAKFGDFCPRDSVA